MITIQNLEDNKFLLQYSNVSEFFAFEYLIKDHLFVGEKYTIVHTDERIRNKIPKGKKSRGYSILTLESDFIQDSFMMLLQLHIKKQNLENVMEIV